MKIVTGHQPVYLPWLGLFHKIALADVFVFMDDVQYLQQDWNNRNKIKTPQGPLWLTVPVALKESESQLLKDIKIKRNKGNEKKFWQAVHWRSIESSYKKSPFFKDYGGFFHDLYMEREWEYLSNLNEFVLRHLLKVFSLNVEFIKASEYGFEGAKSDLVLNHCTKLKGDLCVTGTFGKDYIELEKFKNEGVDIYFQEYVHPQYKQRFGEFVPYLTVLDLLFNCGEESLEIILEGNINREQLIERVQRP